MAAAVARENGLRDLNYGAGAPIELLAEDAAAAHRAQLVWLSITTPPGHALAGQIRKVAANLAEHHIPLIALECCRNTTTQLPSLNYFGLKLLCKLSFNQFHLSMTL